MRGGAGRGESRLKPRLQHSPRVRLPRTALPLLALPLLACGGSAAAGTLAARSDSAGIEIVTSTDPSWGDDGGWRIDSIPIVEIGPRGDDDPRYDLLRVNGGAILPNGEIAVLVTGSAELRFFSATGEWLRTAGGPGDGPGEMRLPTRLIVADDTLFVGDLRHSRISAYTLQGEFLTSWPYPVNDSGIRVSPNWRLGDGRWLGTPFASFVAGQAAAGVTRSPTTWYRIAADLSAVEDDVAVLAGTERVVVVSTGAAGQVTSMQVLTPPIGRNSIGTAGPDFLLSGDNETPELRRRTPDGTLTQVIRWQAPAVPVDAALLNRMKTAELRRAEGDEVAMQGVESRYQTAPLATVVPYFSGIHLDSEGAIWLRAFAPLLADSVRFQIFHTDGQLLGQRSLSPRTTVLGIRENHLLTVWQDDDDLEYVRVYRLNRE